MKFRIEIVSDFYKDVNIKYINFLKSIGFEFREIDFKSAVRPAGSNTWMKHEIVKTTDFVDIELSTLEELLALQAKSGYSLIITDNIIRIYDQHE